MYAKMYEPMKMNDIVYKIKDGFLHISTKLKVKFLHKYRN